MTELELAWVPIEGIWVRHAYAGPEVARHVYPHGRPGRWQTERVLATYLADREPTAWAEFYRFMAERETPPEDAMPQDLFRVRVELERVADLRTEKARRRLGLPRMRPSREQWPAFQAVGEALAEQGAQGVLYASAARTRSVCLCVFEAGLAGLSVVGAPVTVVVPPPPPRGLRT